MARASSLVTKYSWASGPVRLQIRHHIKARVANSRQQNISEDTRAIEISFYFHFILPKLLPLTLYFFLCQFQFVDFTRRDGVKANKCQEAVQD